MNILQQRTFVAKPEQMTSQWYLLDATDKTLGRISTQIANVLRGKNKSLFTAHVDCGDFVIVTNCEKVKLTGKKWTDKIYYRHSNHVGGLKALSAKTVLVKNPQRLIFDAVEGMLPKNKLSHQLMTKLRVYKGSTHPHEAQKPKELTI